MDKSDIIREITIRMMGGDVDSFKTKKQKTLFYSTLLNVADVLQHAEELHQAGVLEFEIKQK